MKSLTNECTERKQQVVAKRLRVTWRDARTRTSWYLRGHANGGSARRATRIGLRMPNRPALGQPPVNWEKFRQDRILGGVDSARKGVT